MTLLYDPVAQEPYTLLMRAPTGGDDASGIAIALADADAYVDASPHIIGVSKVHLRGAEYVLSRALVQSTSGSFKYNTQVPIPLRSASGNRNMQILEGIGPASNIPATPGQSVQQKQGSILRGTLTGQAFDATYKQPSMIGGPTVAPNDFTGFTNINFQIKGLTLRLPLDPSYAALDCLNVGHYKMQDSVVDINHIIAYPEIPATTHSTGIGIISGAVNNPGHQIIEDVQIAGYYTGILGGEHTLITGDTYIYGALIGLGVQTNFYHSLDVVGRFNPEKCAHFVAWADAEHGLLEAGTEAWLFITSFDPEEDGTNFVDHFHFPDNKIYGRVTGKRTVGGVGTSNTNWVKNGAAHLVVDQAKTTD